MRILTVRQPWAWAIVHGGKDVENRVHNIAGDYRGPVAIHTGKKWAGDDALAEVERVVGFYETPGGFILGNIIGTVDLVDAHDASNCIEGDIGGPMQGLGVRWCSEWAEVDGWHLVLKNPRALATPIPFKGALGLRHVDAELEARIWAGVTPC